MYSIESNLSQQARNLNEFSFTWRINCFRMRGRTGSRTSCTSAALWMACEPSRRLGAIRCVIAFSCQCHTVACLGVVSATLPQGTETQCNSLKSQGDDPGVSLCPCREENMPCAFLLAPPAARRLRSFRSNVIYFIERLRHAWSDE